MSNSLSQVWPLPEGEIRLIINTAEPFPPVIWEEDMPALVAAIYNLRIHLGGDM
jgi:hypothetical protein